MLLENRLAREEDRGYTTPCWIWNGGMNKKTGYGNKSGVGLISMTAHRWVYLQVHGSIPPKYHVDHLCRVRSCVNPDHLEAITQKENIRRGDCLKIAFADVVVLRAAKKEGMSNKELASLFELEASYVNRLVNNKVRCDE